MTTPAWLTLLVAVFGLAGVILSQILAHRREDTRWRRERERDQQAWVREDGARSYEQRRDAYINFFLAYHNHWRIYAEAEAQGDTGGAPEDFLEPLYLQLVQIQIFGMAYAAKLAQDAYQALFDHVFRGRVIAADVLDPLQARVRRDLLVLE